MNLTPEINIKGMIDMQWVESLSDQLEHVRLHPASYPEGELFSLPLICLTQVMILLGEHQHHH
eukprot:3778061-Prorocentrum_lima.AAC.1